MPPAVTLSFDLDASLRLAEDAANATRWRTRPTPTITYHDGCRREEWIDTSAGPCLILVRDKGVYLMSSNEDAPRDQTGRRLVVYAQGYDPRTNSSWDSTWRSEGLGGDDFAEHLELVESGLLDDIRVAVGDNYRWFIVTMTAHRLRLRFGATAYPPSHR